jgi:hypothetical protein
MESYKYFFSFIAQPNKLNNFGITYVTKFFTFSSSLPYYVGITSLAKLQKACTILPSLFSLLYFFYYFLIFFVLLRLYALSYSSENSSMELKLN